MTFCNLVRALWSGSCDKKSHSEHQTLLSHTCGEGLGTRLAAVCIECEPKNCDVSIIIWLGFLFSLKRSFPLNYIHVHSFLVHTLQHQCKQLYHTLGIVLSSSHHSLLEVTCMLGTRLRNSPWEGTTFFEDPFPYLHKSSCYILRVHLLSNQTVVEFC